MIRRFHMLLPYARRAEKDGSRLLYLTDRRKTRTA
jgi:hypothetical protein